MVRAPCCEKMGLKKGPWTPEEDQILINYIQLYGHGNWRALPKLAGLLRCGKSCRLRWTNYLRPDIKRGNFSREEEDYIINLHEMLGNRWSAIAGRLPGRTDNEIKNVWHTRLKKRIKQSQNQTTAAAACAAEPGRQILMIDVSKEGEGPVKNHVRSESGSSEYRPVSDPVLEECSSEDMSSSATTAETCVKMEPSESEEGFVEIIDENFWSEMLSADNPGEAMSDLSSAGGGGDSWQLQFPDTCAVLANASNSNGYENMEFWHDLSTRSAGGGGDSWRLQFPDTCAVLANASNSNGFENMEFWHDFLLDRPGNYLNCQSFDRI